MTLTLKQSWRLVALVAACVLALYAALAVSGQPPVKTLKDFADGAFGSLASFSGTLRETTPLLLLGVGVYIALRAGLFNIGIEGQFVMGAITCSAIAVKMPGPAGIVLGSLGGTVVGALWAYPAAWIRAYKGGHEVITTIMLNRVAGLLTGYLIAGPLKSPGAGYPTTTAVSDETRLPMLTGGALQINLALLLGIALILGVWWWLKRTVAGYELQIVGANATAAQFAGVEVRKVMVRAMLVSGAIGGLAGAFQLLAFQPQFQGSFSPGYGFDALGVALLAASTPWLLIPAAFFFGILNQGGNYVVIFGVPRGVTGIVLGLLVLVTAAIRYRRSKAVD